MRYPLVLALPAVLLGWSCDPTSSGSEPPVRADRPEAGDDRQDMGTVYDGDPGHLWNRLLRLLYSRTAQNGELYTQESLEPLFLPGSRFLAEGPSYQHAVSFLDDFLKEKADERIKDPLKRAVFQRDLWAVFSATVPDPQRAYRIDDTGRIMATDRFEDPGDAASTVERRTSRRQLQRRLVQIIRRVALKPEEVAALPDNLAQAVKAGTFPDAFDPNEEGRAFLPRDLLADDGSWVPVSNLARANEDLPAAPEHARFTRGRSVFLVLLHLPEGRKATAALLKKMHDGEILQLPEGAQTALLRRTLLIDDSGTLRESPLTESLQIRVYKKQDLGIPSMFTLRRKDLFAGRNGGLRPVGGADTSYFDFQTRGGDVFEQAVLPRAEAVMQTCSRCHTRTDGREGIYSVNTIYASRDAGPSPTGLCSTTLSEESERTIGWVRKSYTWGLLQGLWEARPGG
ncbi:MAG: hypothetical protein P4L85_10110 [Paludisphaera borealis]|uniref:hypothetical protein n=1 Tax=Paludisphaera borealis TaxID=1387353 RepID=UPI00283EA9C2|nr:hypothetical protein [Paludisphaera borealis]MDR3619694.1 hypothetical protein [Paludisphaera borealis]